MAKLAATVVVLALISMIAVGFSDRYVPVVADWYSSMVIRYLPEPALRFAPTDDDNRAFYACAKSVVKEIEDASSVVTFDSGGEAVTVALGEDRYQVESVVEEARLDGSTYRRTFTCVVRLEEGAWHLENVRLAPPPSSVASGEFAA